VKLSINDRLLARLPLEKEVGNTGGLAHSLGIVDQTFGLLSRKPREVHPSDAQHAVHEVLEALLIGEGQVPLENHTVKAGENTGDSVFVLANERKPLGAG
jgi:hypothetical protein